MLISGVVGWRHRRRWWSCAPSSASGAGLPAKSRPPDAAGLPLYSLFSRGPGDAARRRNGPGRSSHSADDFSHFGGVERSQRLRPDVAERGDGEAERCRANVVIGFDDGDDVMLAKRPEERMDLHPALLGHCLESVGTLGGILYRPNSLIREICKYYVVSHVDLPDPRRRAGRIRRDRRFSRRHAITAPGTLHPGLAQGAADAATFAPC